MGSAAFEYLVLWFTTVTVVLFLISVNPYKHWKRDLFNMIFRPKFYAGNLMLEKQRISDEMQEVVHRKTQALLHDIDMGHRGLVKNDWPQLELLEIPIVGIDQREMSYQPVHTTRKDVERLMVSISHNGLPLERIKQHAASELARKLIEKGLLKADVDASRNRVMFYVNYFE
jgi:hypothetical protein